MKKDKNLQKLTDMRFRIEELLKKDSITLDDIQHFTKEEHSLFSKLLTEKLNSLTGTDRDTFIEKIDPITTRETKNQLWEQNHANITRAIAKLIQDYGRMPGKSELADETGLSRQTIHKHLKEYREHPLFEGEIAQFQFLASKVLAKVFYFAVTGDMKAAKLYFEIIGCSGKNAISNPSNIFINQQNNFIQQNQAPLDMSRLTDEQLRQLLEIMEVARPAKPGNHTLLP